MKLILASHDTPAATMLNDYTEFWQCAISTTVLKRAFKMAVVVGSVLVLINYGDKLLTGALTARDGIKIAVTYCVPFCVSAFSSACALVALRK